MRIGSRGFLVASAAGLAVLVAVVGSASAAGPPPGIAAGPAFGFVPSRNANHAVHQGRILPLQYHGGPVQHSTTVIPIFWGSASAFGGDKVSGLDALYHGIGGTPYAHTNSEYTDGNGAVNTTAITNGTNVFDTTATPSGSPSTSQVLAEVAKVTNNHPVAGAYYPVYSDKPRGSAGYCAWHSTGTIDGVRVQFGFFFDLDGDPGCNPDDTGTGHSEGLAALANVSGHELSEMLTDPLLNAWYDQKGEENADKCAWMFGGLVTIGGQQWKIQENWSNAAAACIQTS